MKIYSSEIKPPSLWQLRGIDAINAAIETYEREVKADLIRQGYDGKHSGKTISFPVADGYANYMIGHKGNKFFLVLLCYGGAYQYHDASFLPRAEILRRVDQQASVNALFTKKRAAA